MLPLSFTSPGVSDLFPRKFVRTVQLTMEKYNKPNANTSTEFEYSVPSCISGATKATLPICV